MSYHRIRPPSSLPPIAGQLGQALLQINTYYYSTGNAQFVRQYERVTGYRLPIPCKYFYGDEWTDWSKTPNWQSIPKNEQVLITYKFDLQGCDLYGGRYKGNSVWLKPSGLVKTKIKAVQKRGCSDRYATNFDPNRTIDDDSLCTYDTIVCADGRTKAVVLSRGKGVASDNAVFQIRRTVGCELTTCWDGSLVANPANCPPTTGCMDRDYAEYDPKANVSDPTKCRTIKKAYCATTNTYISVKDICPPPPAPVVATPVVATPVVATPVVATPVVATPVIAAPPAVTYTCKDSDYAEYDPSGTFMDRSKCKTQVKKWCATLGKKIPVSWDCPAPKPQPQPQPQPQPKPKPLVCPAELAYCPSRGGLPDAVLRDRNNNCQFPTCSDGSIPKFADGTPVVKPITVEPQPKPLVCPADVAYCANGDPVIREAFNNCEFQACRDGSTPTSTKSKLTLSASEIQALEKRALESTKKTLLNNLQVLINENGLGKVKAWAFEGKIRLGGSTIDEYASYYDKQYIQQVLAQAEANYPNVSKDWGGFEHKTAVQPVAKTVSAAPKMVFLAPRSNVRAAPIQRSASAARPTIRRATWRR